MINCAQTQEFPQDVVDVLSLCFKAILIGLADSRVMIKEIAYAVTIAPVEQLEKFWDGRVRRDLEGMTVRGADNFLIAVAHPLHWIGRIKPDKGITFQFICFGRRGDRSKSKSGDSIQVSRYDRLFQRRVLCKFCKDLSGVFD
jgi:hypothetical protein